MYQAAVDVAAARSMAGSWHDFIFGAFDPAGTVTIDKLPGALWVQALSLRIFGFHIWALVLPQVAEGVLTVLVLYRAVRRLAGPAAAAVLAVTPVTVLLSRGNVSDSLLILLLVLAADATSAALLSGSLRQLLLAGVWVGLAFQAKMIQAWLALPALAAAYLLAAPAAKLRTRCAHVALAGLVTAVVSLSWMTAVSLVPSQDRPYVDGSPDDWVYTQVFDYNGLGRLTGNWASIAGPPSPLVVAAVESGQLLNAETAVAFVAAAVLLLPAAASVNGVIRGLGPFDTPFESPETAHDNQQLAADAPALTRAVQRLELQTPPGDALLGTDTSGLAQSYILYSGREVLPIGGYLGNVPAPTLATLQADISRGYVRVFVLPVSPPGPDPRVRWIESHCTRQPQPPHRRPVPYATFFCGLGTGPEPSSSPASTISGTPSPDPALKPGASVVFTQRFAGQPLTDLLTTALDHPGHGRTEKAHEQGQRSHRAAAERVFRVHVYAGIDPVTGKPRRLTRTCPDEAAAAAALGQLLSQIGAHRRLHGEPMRRTPGGCLCAGAGGRGCGM